MSQRSFRFVRWVIALSGPSLLLQSAFAQSNTGTLRATATIIQPVTISSESTLAFGNIMANSTTGGVVVVSPSGSSTVAGVVRPGANAGVVSAATFRVSGVGGLLYSVSFASSSITLTDGGSNSMIVNGLTTASANEFSLKGGSDTLSVGGTLRVNAGQAAANYSGSVQITVAYN